MHYPSKYALHLAMCLLPLLLSACPGSYKWREEIPESSPFLNAISGRGPDVILTVGGTKDAGAKAKRFDGQKWITETTNIANSLYYVTVQSESLAIAVESPSDFHRCEIAGGMSTWTAFPSLPNAPENYVFGVWSTPSRLYAVGEPPLENQQKQDNRFYIFNGASWTHAVFDSEKSLYGVGGTSDTNVIAVGDEGLIVRWNGDDAVIMDSPTTRFLNAVWVGSPSLAYAVGEDGLIMRYNGLEWRLMESGVNVDLNSVWGSASDDVFAVGPAGLILHYNGRAWSEQDSGTTREIYSVWGTSRSNVYAVTDHSAILHYGP